MRCIIRWKARGAGSVRSSRLSRLDHLLAQAAQSGYYRRQSLVLPECAPHDETALGQCLERIPRIALRDFLSNPVEFYNWDQQDRPLRPLECPLAHTGRTALLLDGFEESETVRTFTYLTSGELEEFEPDSIAGSCARLRTLAEAALDGRLKLGSLRSAIIAFTGLKHGCLRQEDRDLLWRAFQVPVFEQFRGFSQELLAWECEAHDGLHIHDENAIFEAPQGEGELLLTCLGCTEYALLRLGTEMSAWLVKTPCGCGGASSRLMGLRPHLVRRPATMAAAAGAGVTVRLARGIS